MRKIPSNFKFVPSINITEVGLLALLKLYSFLKFKHRMWFKAQFHSNSTGQVHTCSFLKVFWQRSSLVSPGLQNRTIKIFTTFEVIKQSDFPDLCRLHRGCDLEELHTRMCWRTFSFFPFFFFLIISNSQPLILPDNLPDNRRHTVTTLQTWAFPVGVSTVVYGWYKEILKFVFRSKKQLKCNGYLWITKALPCQSASFVFCCPLDLLLEQKDLPLLASEY